ncbi:MAG TPA: class II aldolase/adducin family protein [Candidatus Solibacter sp.]|jgi:ribulose-5-phosphate 4-epimerase/fuculose-1-phosphate aldolase|nr:class II aldolase/adducin family protein [Candidatus Solibacter sp.]
MSAALEGIKWDICCAARILYRAGLSVGVAGHLSVAIGENRMLMNRFGPSFATLRPVDMVTFDFEGKVVEHDPSVDPYVNDTVALHAVIHRYNPKIVAVAHTHPPMAITWSTFRRVPEVYDQESCMLAGDVAIVEEDYTGLAASEDRVKPFADALAKQATAILPNHGALTTGPNVQVAAFRMLLLEGMCARNISVALAAQSTGLKPHPIKAEDALTAKAELARIPGLQPMWKDYLQRLQQTDPDLFENRPRTAAA